MAGRQNVMDEVNSWLIAIGLAALGAAVWLLAERLLALQTDMELAGIKTPARTPGRND
jgi:hypothetical protein